MPSDSSPDIQNETGKTSAQWQELLDGMRRRVEAIDQKIKAASGEHDVLEKCDDDQA